MPFPVLMWRNWFCNFFTRLTMETVFERDCSSKIGSKSQRLVFAQLSSMWDTTVLGIFWIPLQRDGTCDFVLPTRPSLWTFARSNQFWVVIHDRLGLWEIDREHLWNVHLESQLFCIISSTHSRLFGTLSCSSVLPCRAPWQRPFLDHVVRDRESIQS